MPFFNNNGIKVNIYKTQRHVEINSSWASAEVTLTKSQKSKNQREDDLAGYFLFYEK